ncbi:hypothetical protein LJR066_002511 [Acidovorax sp. LjRoot66]|uniref:hypothetical protein n=1 Tax=Acidovorax sp. LjRoot66 TaxID=3342334 RepID=UPI003ECD203D
MSPLPHLSPLTPTPWRLLLLHPANHWPLYALAGTACLLVACVLAEALTHPEALALAIFLFTGVVVDALLAPGGPGRWLPAALALAAHAAALLWSLALAKQPAAAADAPACTAGAAAATPGTASAHCLMRICI